MGHSVHCCICSYSKVTAVTNFCCKSTSFPLLMTYFLIPLYQSLDQTGQRSSLRLPTDTHFWTLTSSFTHASICWSSVFGKGSAYMLRVKVLFKGRPPSPLRPLNPLIGHPWFPIFSFHPLFINSEQLPCSSWRSVYRYSPTYGSKTDYAILDKISQEHLSPSWSGWLSLYSIRCP